MHYLITTRMQEELNEKVRFHWRTTLNKKTQFSVNYSLFIIRLSWDSEKIFQCFIRSLSKRSSMKSYFRRRHPVRNLAPSSRERDPYTLGTACPGAKKLCLFPRHPLVPGTLFLYYCESRCTNAGLGVHA